MTAVFGSATFSRIRWMEPERCEPAMGFRSRTAVGGPATMCSADVPA